jgi:serine/threonine protein kinase
LYALLNGIDITDDPELEPVDCEVLSSTEDEEVGLRVTVYTQKVGDKVMVVKKLGIRCDYESRKTTIQNWAGAVKELSTLFVPELRRCSNITQVAKVLVLESPYGEYANVLVAMERGESDLATYQQYTLEQGLSLSIQEKIELCEDVINGLDTLHSVGIAHGDLK